jgi:hypothetical protein
MSNCNIHIAICNKRQEKKMRKGNALRFHLFTTDAIRFAFKSNWFRFEVLDMRQRLAFLFAFLIIAATSAAQSNTDQDKDKGKDTDRAELVTTAEITKVDAKKRTLQVKELVQPTANDQRDGGSHGRRNGGYGGGRRRNGGIGFPGGGGGYPGGGTGGGGTTTKTKEYKVWVTKDTVLKLADTNIEFKDLRVGDRVTISGFPKGSKDLEARTITRNFQ